MNDYTSEVWLQALCMIKTVNYFSDQKVEGIFMKGIRPHIKIK